jgi:hypothetical protein
VITHTIYHTTVTLARESNVGPNSYPLSTGVVLETLITALVQVSDVKNGYSVALNIN